MNRLQFLSELKKSLLKTTKEITFPILSEEVEKIDKVTDEFIGVKWHELKGISPESFQDVEEHFIENKSVLLCSDGTKLTAFNKVCSECQSLVQLITYEKKIKCFTCDKSYNFELKTGDLLYKHYYIKEKDGNWFIGM